MLLGANDDVPKHPLNPTGISQRIFMARRQICSVGTGGGKGEKQLGWTIAASIHSSVFSKHHIFQPLVCWFLPVKSMWLVPEMPLSCKERSNWGTGEKLCMAQAFWYSVIKAYLHQHPL